MNKLKKISFWLLAGFVAIAVFLTVFALIIDRIVKQEQILSKIQAGASQVVGGKVQLETIELEFFPRPNIIIHQVNFSIPKTAAGSLESLTLYPRLLPLLKGQFLCSRMDLDTPDIKIQLPEKQAPQDKQQKPWPPDIIKNNIGTVFKVISSKAPGLSISVENGRLNFVKGAKTGFEINDIYARIDLPPDTVQLRIECKSGKWERIFLKGSIYSAENKSLLDLAELKLDPYGFNLSGKLEINHPLQAPSPSFDLTMKGTDVDVHSVRKIVRELAGDTPVVQDIFDIVKGGQVPLITFSSHGNSLAEIGKMDNIHIQGRMQNGEIFVPEVDLDLTHVQGDVVISKGILQGSHLEARLGNSQGRQGTLKLGLAGGDVPFHLDLIIDGDLAQLPSVLTSLVHNDTLTKELALVKDLEGKATGRLIMGKRLSSFETIVKVSDFKLSADYRRLPYRLNMQGEQFVYKNNKVILKNVRGRMSKSSFSGISLALDFNNTTNLELKAGASTLSMDEIYPWLFAFDTLRNKLYKLKPIKGVLSLAELTLQGPPLLPEKWHLQTSGDLALEQGLNISVDLAVNPNELNVNKLIIKDRISHASARLAYKDNAFTLFYNGILNKATLDNLIKENQILKGWINGDFQTHVFLDQPFKSTVQGNLQLNEFIVPWPRKNPLVINSLAMEAKQDHLRIKSASLSLAEDLFYLKGNAKFYADGLNFEMDLNTDALNIDKIEQALGKKQKEKLDQAGQKAKPLPVQGHLTLKAEKFIYKGLSWSPFYSDINIKDGIATVTVTEANLCGIATPGNLQISPQQISLDVQPTAKDRRLYPTIHCLLDKSVKVEGNFDFNGNITAQAADKDLLGAINGDFNFTAGKGRFYSGQFHGILVDLVRLLSITEIFRGKLPDIGREGFGYNSIKTKADIKDGHIRLDEMIIDGTAMTIVVHGGYDLAKNLIDCVALVSPLKTIDAVFTKIPLIKDVVGGTVYNVAYSIKGPPDNPEIRQLSNSEVDSELLGIMQRTIRLPIKIIQPAISGEKQKYKSPY